MTVPIEILNRIFAFLSFEERILCTVVCKHWQQLLLDSPEMWTSISHQHNMPGIADTLKPYRQYIRPSFLRSLTLIKPWVEPDEDEDEDFVREIKNAALEEDVAFLEHCTHIQHVCIDSSYWSQVWMEKLYSMTRASLTHLDIQCSDEQLAGRVLHLRSILEQFPVLEHLSLVCPVLFPASTDQRINLWDTDTDRAAPTHERLTDLHVDLYGNKKYWDLPLDRIVAQLPQLARLSIHPRDYRNLPAIVQALMEHCVHIDTISIFVESGIDPLQYDTSMHPASISPAPLNHYNYNHHVDGSKLRHVFLQNTAAHPQVVRSVIHKHSTTLETLALRSDEAHFYSLLSSISRINMPCLQTVRFLNTGDSPLDPPEYEAFFSRHPQLQRVAILSSAWFRDRTLHVLCSHQLNSLELQQCDITEKAMIQFFSGYQQRSSLRKLVLIDIPGMTDNVFALVKLLPGLKHITLLRNRITFPAVVSFLAGLDTPSSSMNGSGSLRDPFDFLGLECLRCQGSKPGSSSDTSTEDVLDMLDLVATKWHFQIIER